MSRLNTHRSVLVLALAIVALIALSCSDDSAPRSTVTIDSINGGEILDCDLYNNGDDNQQGTGDDFIVEDQVSVLMRNRPHDAGLTIDPNGPFGAVVFHRCDVRFTGDEALAPVSSALHLRVPSGSTVQGEILVVPAAYKIAPPLFNILQDGGEIRLEAHITLIGEEEDSHDEVIVTAILPVHCANWADE